jgi:hypothetical protein
MNSNRIPIDKPGWLHRELTMQPAWFYYSSSCLDACLHARQMTQMLERARHYQPPGELCILYRAIPVTPVTGIARKTP